jgi:hypothetical protein
VRIDTGTVRDFLAALDKWLQALARGDRSDAAFYAREVAERGRIVAVDPTFRRLFEQHRGACRPDFDPAGTIECVASFVSAVSALQQARAGAAEGNGHSHAT